MNRKIMCAYCGEFKKYPEEFPSSIYAQCQECVDREQKERESGKFINKIRKILRRIR